MLLWLLFESNKNSKIGNPYESIAYDEIGK